MKAKNFLAILFISVGIDAMPQTFIELQKLTYQDSANAYFGNSVNINNDIAVIGIPGGETSNGKTGNIKIARKAGNIWQYENFNMAGGPDDNIGISVSNVGEHIVVGASFDDEKGTNAGAVYEVAYLNVLSGHVWMAYNKITASDGSDYDIFGSSTEMEEYDFGSSTGKIIAVGAPGDDDNGNQSGSVYVYIDSTASSSSNSYLEIKIKPDDGAANDNFGKSVSLAYPFIAIGAPGCDGGGTSRGAVYVFEILSDGTYQQYAKLTPSDAGDYDNFGTSLSFNKSDKTLVAGSPKNDEVCLNAGAAYVYSYHYVTGLHTWQLDAKLIPDGAQTEIDFGGSVAISDDKIVVGADHDNGNEPASGAIYVYYNNAGNWQLNAKLTASDGNQNDLFGYSVSIDGDFIISGAKYDSDIDSRSGSAYIFTPHMPEITQQPDSLFNICIGDSVAFSVSGDSIIAYQWEIKYAGTANFTLLEYVSGFKGALTNTLYFNVDDPDLDSARFRCRVSNQYGYEYSDIALLTTDSISPAFSNASPSIYLDSLGNASLTLDDIDATDNCGIINFSASPSSFDCSQTGYNSVYIKLEDGAGNILYDTISVLVADTLAPTITCPGDMDVIANVSDSMYLVTGTELDVLTEDNCSVNNITNNINGSISLAGHSFPLGTTDILWIVSDNSNNSNNCHISLTVNRATAVQDAKADAINMFPNPVKDDLNIILPEKPISVTIVTVTGELLYKTENTRKQMTIDMSHYVNAVYFVKINTSKGISTFRIVKQ